MQSSIVKQFIYAVFYIVLFSSIGYGAYFFILQGEPTCFDGRKNQNEVEIDCGGSCELCAIRNLLPIEASQIFIIEHDEALYSLVLELKNPNVTFGSPSFGYSIRFFDENNAVVSTLEKSSFIYPGEIKFIVESNIRPNKPFQRAEVLIHNVFWRQGMDFSIPKFQLRSIETEYDVENNRVFVKGIFMNQNSFPLARVTLNALFNLEGISNAASKTLIQSLAPSEERAFQITLPLPKDAQFTQDNVFLYAEVER